MPWVDAAENSAAPPVGPGPIAEPGEDAVVDLEDRWGSIEGADLAGEIDAGACERLEIRGSRLRGVRLDVGDGCRIDLDHCELIECDLSTLRLESVTASRFVDCKLTGCDLSEATVRDAEFDRCLLRLVNGRMARLERVVLRGCTLDDVDLFDARLADVSFPESALRAVDADRVGFHHVDLREAAEVDLRSVKSLAGCLITVDQVVELAFVLAHAAGVEIERPDEPR